jgi:hypothetical protein
VNTVWYVESAVLTTMTVKNSVLWDIKSCSPVPASCWLLAWLAIWPCRTKLKLNSVALVREQIIPTKRQPLVGEVSAKFADRGCRVVSATDSS